jgi:hypothetical protein
MKTVDFAIFLNHPSVAAIFLAVLGAIMFAPPRLRVWEWRKRKSKMEEWIDEKPITDRVSVFTACFLCGESRTRKIVVEVLPERMEATLLSTKKFGQITYSGLRCAKCGREIGRAKKRALI